MREGREGRERDGEGWRMVVSLIRCVSSQRVQSPVRVTEKMKETLGRVKRGERVQGGR